MSAILTARGLTRRFVTRKPLFGAPTVVQAVNGVDLDIEEGETFAIVGNPAVANPLWHGCCRT